MNTVIFYDVPHSRRFNSFYAYIGSENTCQIGKVIKQILFSLIVFYILHKASVNFYRIKRQVFNQSKGRKTCAEIIQCDTNTTGAKLNYNVSQKGHIKQTASLRYLEGQMAKIELPQKDDAFLRERILTMYANPLRNYLLKR